jgi:hypothetical protein
MATNYNYPDPANIEAQAQYRPGVASNIFNVLTGGLAGAVTGTTQRAQEAARARQALLQEDFNKRDEERAIKKQMMENTLRLKIAAAEGGLGLLPGSNPEEVLAQAMEARKRREIGTEAAQMAALGRTPQGMALLANRQDPAFQSGYGATKRDILGKELEAVVQEKIQTPAFRSQLLGMDPNAEIPEGATAAQMKGMIEARRYQLPFQMRQKADVEGLVDMYASNPGLKAFEGYTPETIGKAAPVLAKSLMVRANRELVDTADTINKQRKADSTKEFADILNLPPQERTNPQNVARLNQLASDVPSYYTQSPKFKSAVGIGDPLDDKQLQQIQDYDKSLMGINRFVSILDRVSKNPASIKKFQNANFGTIQDAVRTQKSKFFANDDERELARELVQEYEGFVSGERKILFGQSLVGREESSASVNFGKPTDKDFFNRALQFIDRTVQYDPVTFYLNSGLSVPEGTAQDIINKKRQFNEYKSNPQISPFFGSFRNQGTNAPVSKQKIMSITPL